MKEGVLGIQNFEPELLHQTYYYFRLGKYVSLWEAQTRDFSKHVELGKPGSEAVVIPARGSALISSLELFRCSRKVLGMFGPPSALFRMGFRLDHSPSIDPGFDGALELSIQNIQEIPLELKYGDWIGKVMFFDISDTYPIKDPKETMSAEEYERRRKMKFPQGFSAPNRVRARMEE